MKLFLDTLPKDMIHVGTIVTISCLVVNSTHTQELLVTILEPYIPPGVGVVVVVTAIVVFCTGVVAKCLFL